MNYKLTQTLSVISSCIILSLITLAHSSHNEISNYYCDDLASVTILETYNSQLNSRDDIQQLAFAYDHCDRLWMFARDAELSTSSDPGELKVKGLIALEISARLGIHRSQIFLALAYSAGNGLEVDKEKALYWAYIAINCLENNTMPNQEAAPFSYSRIAASIEEDTDVYLVSYIKDKAWTDHFRFCR